MKKLIVLACSLLALSSTAQEENGWRVGLQMGILANNSRLSGGIENANGRFRQNDFSSPNINITGRYDFNRHWTIESGIGINTFGFDYSISEDYSLKFGREKLASIYTSFAALELPVDLYYKFRINCKHARWVLGAGLVPTFLGAQTAETDYSVTSEGASTNYLNSNSASEEQAALLLRWTIGREKIFRNGSIFRASLLVNMGFSNLATSTVNYTLDNGTYSHSFINSGSSVGLRLAYFLPAKNSSRENLREYR